MANQGCELGLPNSRAQTSAQGFPKLPDNKNALNMIGANINSLVLADRFMDMGWDQESVISIPDNSLWLALNPSIKNNGLDSAGP